MRTGSLFMKIAMVAALGISAASCSKKDNDLMTDPAMANKAENGGALTGANSNWQLTSTPVFTIETPNTWSYTDLHGIDTYNGLLGDGRDSMRFDYGMANDTFQIDPELYTFHYEVVDGKKAKIIEGLSYPKRYGIAIDNIPRASSASRRFILMQASGRQMDEATAMRIIRSVKFK